MKLTSEKVEEIFLDCLLQKQEIFEGKPKNGIEPIEVEGIVNNFFFHPERLGKHKDETIELLKELPTEFFQNGGGGWSFLNACINKDGAQWGEHRNIEQLFCLGMGLNIVKYQLPRHMWAVLPGGMPYVVINIEE